jgi:uncharacterized damage-inducible protein DinB
MQSIASINCLTTIRMAYSIIQHLQYNAWANKRIAATTELLDDHIFYHERESSFPSIAKTMLHVWDAEQVWINRLKGISLTAFPSVHFKGDKSDIINGFRNSSDELVQFISEKDLRFLDRSYEYTTMKGQQFTDTVEETLYHIVNHGTYHRGQIITMLRTAGITSLPATDLIFFMRESRVKQ